MRSSSEIDKPALEAARRGESSGVRVFKLKRHKRNEGLPVKVAAFGCHGDGIEHQQPVAAALQKLFERGIAENKENLPKKPASDKTMLIATSLHNRNIPGYRQMFAEQQKKEAANPADYAFRGIPDLVFLLGDNAYTYGSNAPTDPVMNECFRQAYIKNKDCPLLNQTLYVVIGGNHDSKYCKQVSLTPFYDPEKPGADLGVNRLMNQIAYTYITHDEKGFQQFNTDLDTLLNSPPTAQEVADGYRELDMDDLLSKNCHYLQLRRFYSLIIEDHQYFCIDSSDFPRDFLAYKRLKKQLSQLDPALAENAVLIKDINQQLKNNQAYFLAEESKKALAAGRTMILATHHSVVTDGSRHHKDDRKIYLSKNEMEELTKIFDDDSEVEDIFKTPPQQANDIFNNITPEAERRMESNLPAIREQDEFDTNMNSQLFQSLRMLGLMRKDRPIYDGILTAHDHNLSNFCTVNTNNNSDDYQFSQFTAGGGSNRELQARIRLSNQRYRGCFLKKPGLLEVVHHRAKETSFIFRTADGENNLLFNNLSPKAVVNYDRYAMDIEYHFKDEYESNVEMRTAFRASSQKITAQKDRYKKLFGTVEAAINRYFETCDKKHKNGIEYAHSAWAFIAEAEPKIRDFDAVVQKILALAGPKTELLYQIIEDKLAPLLPNDIAERSTSKAETPSLLHRAMSTLFNAKPDRSKTATINPRKKSTSADDLAEGVSKINLTGSLN